MNKIISVAGAAALIAGLSLSAIAPANAQMYHRHFGPGFGPGPALGLGILGFAAGAAVAGAARGNDGYYGGGYYGGDYRAHVAACEDAYRSYDVRTDTYLGYDGYRHECDL
jgi:hypothetical protein